GPRRTMGAADADRGVRPAASAQGDADRAAVHPQRGRRPSREEVNASVLSISPQDPTKPTPRRSIVLLTVVCGLATALLVGLGVGQSERGTWKRGLIAGIEARVNAPRVTLDQVLAENRATGDIESPHVSVPGHYLPSLERYLYAPAESGPGYDVFAPLVTP